jgi:hypothetical protein
MARSFKDLRDEIIINLGNRDDADAVKIINSSINTAVETICLSYDLPEMRKLGELSYIAGVDELWIQGTSKLNDILSVRNRTKNITMGFIPLENLDWMAPTTGEVRFYSRDGNAILVRPTPAEDTTIWVRYTVYPSRLTEDTSQLPYEGYDGQTVAIATLIAWASLEEVEASSLWGEIVKMLSIPYTLSEEARSIIEGISTLKEKATHDNTQ